MPASIDSKTSATLSNIRNQRIAKEYSQYYVAVKLGISQNAYSKIELGHSNVTLDKLFAIAEVLETDLSRLISPEIA
jgi:transcriptional regulator with XRE-family HTH domain